MTRVFLITTAGIDFREPLHVPLGIVPRLNASASIGAHFLDQIGAVEQKPDGMRELAAITGRIKQARHSVLNELAARTKIGRDHGTSVGIGFEDRFPQRFIGKGREHREGASAMSLCNSSPPN